MKKVPYTLSEDSITIVWEGKPYTIRKDNANFSEVRRALFEARYEDVGDLLDLKSAVEDFIEGAGRSQRMRSFTIMGIVCMELSLTS